MTPIPERSVEPLIKSDSDPYMPRCSLCGRWHYGGCGSEPLFKSPDALRASDRLADLAANLADLSTTLRAAARAAGRASAALWGMNDPPESDDA